ncbi:MAG: RsmG family class I SAM-dependent methyltransferase [Ilumatobacteraceae bacterium]
MNDDLLDTLRTAQRVGFFGRRPIEQAVEHSMSFVDALRDITFSTLLDLGSGGGLPGLVVASEFPDVRITLLDRRQKRTDFLEQAVRRLGYAQVSVRFADVRSVVDEVRRGVTARADVVTARGFGPPEDTIRVATDLVTERGRIVISEPPTGDRWSAELLGELGLTSERLGAVRMFTRR